MQLSTRDGIACDYCGTTHKIDFDYYSFDMRSVEIHNNMRPSIESILMSDTVHSYDICPSCFQDFKKLIVSNNNSPKNMMCDFSGEIVREWYYYVVVAKISVKFTGAICTCVKCKNKTYNTKMACTSCGGKDFIATPQVNTTKRFLEANMSNKFFDTFTDKIKSVRKIAGEWSTNST